MKAILVMNDVMSDVTNKGTVPGDQHPELNSKGLPGGFKLSSFKNQDAAKGTFLLTPTLGPIFLYISDTT